MKKRIDSKFILQGHSHKIMRKEIAMNIFPFGEDGADPSTIIRAIRSLVTLLCINNDIRELLYSSGTHQNLTYKSV